MNPIKGLLIQDESLAIKLGRHLYDRGYVVTCATFPTVSKGAAMLRIALSSLHTTADIRGLANQIRQFSVTH